MEKMSEMGKGNYYYMADPDSCGKAFATELAGLLTVVAQKVKITITPEKDRMKVLEVMDDVDVTEEEGQVVISIPDVIAGETRYILIKVSTKAQDKAWARSASIAAVSTEFLNMIEGAMSSEKGVPVKIEFVKSEFDTVLDAEVKTQLAIIEAIKAQETANVMASQGNYAGAQGVMYDAAMNLSGTGTVRGMSIGAGVNTTSAFYACANSFTSSTNTRSAGMKAFKSGRATGSVFDDALTTDTQKAYQKDWKDSDDAPTQDAAVVNTGGTFSIGTMNGNITVDGTPLAPSTTTLSMSQSGLSKKSKDRW
jgi:hypothetical protein